MSLTITIITGARGSGKTTYLKNLIEEYISCSPSRRIGGVITSAAIAANTVSLKTEYKAVHVIDGEAKLLLSDHYRENWKPLGRFWYNPDTFSWAVSLIQKDASYCSLVVLDEIGPLELKGGGYAECLQQLLLEFEGELILVIREEILQNAINHFSLANKNIHICHIRGDYYAE